MSDLEWVGTKKVVSERWGYLTFGELVIWTITALVIVGVTLLLMGVL